MYGFRIVILAPTYRLSWQTSSDSVCLITSVSTWSESSDSELKFSFRKTKVWSFAEAAWGPKRKWATVKKSTYNVEFQIAVVAPNFALMSVASRCMGHIVYGCLTIQRFHISLLHNEISNNDETRLSRSRPMSHFIKRNVARIFSPKK